MGAIKSPLYRNPRYRCCGAHVEKLALALAIVLIVFTLVETVLGVMHNWWNAFLLLEILVLLLIFPAQCLRRPFLYIPFLIFQAFFAVLLVVYYANVLLGIVLALIYNKNVLDGVTNSVSYEYSNIIKGLPAAAEHSVVEPSAAPISKNGTLPANATSVEVAAPEAQALETRKAGGGGGSEHTAAEHVVTLVVIGIGLLYTALVLLHYYVVVRAFRYLRDERRANNSIQQHAQDVIFVQQPSASSSPKYPLNFNGVTVIRVDPNDADVPKHRY